MEKCCPINTELVDSKLIRLNAAVIFFILVLFIFTKKDLLIYYVLADFLIRVIFGFRFSPVCIAIRYSLNLMKVEPNKINAGPKKLAAKFGLVFSLLTTVFFIADYKISCLIIVTLFAIATGLEAFFDFCMVCKIYPYLKKLGL
jgi:hypothetical protein